MKRLAFILALAMAVSGIARGESPDSDSANPAAPAASALGERLIYSVDRSPQDTFDAPRSVTVIGRDELLRRNGMTLAEVLAEETGLVVHSSRQAGSGAPVMRGMMGRHLLIMIDGVKINDTLWRTNAVAKEQLNLIDLTQIDRIEIVRGVVSVLGTEALGGVVNVVTRKGPDGSEGFGGTVGFRYASADQSISTPVSVWGRLGRLSFHAGGQFSRRDDLRAGDGVDQPYTGYEQRAAHLNAQYLFTQERSLSLSYQYVDAQEVDFWQYLVSNVPYDHYTLTPVRMKMASAAFQDLTSYPWSDALSVTAYWNVQEDGTERLPTKVPKKSEFAYNEDRMTGFNVEMGKFLGSHHILYGIDTSQEKIGSTTLTTDLATGTVAETRGRYTDGATYQALSLYMNDKFSVTRWVTVSAGIRHGRFKTAGNETVPLIGEMNLDSSQSGTTGALNVVLHASPRLNIIGGAFRGFRAPSLDDMSKYFVLGNQTTVETPNPSVSPERIESYEGGFKYAGSIVSGSLFYYDNALSDVIVRAPSTVNGLPFIDRNGNGKQEAGEPNVLQNRNVGEATIRGIEAELEITPRRGLRIFANFTKTEGTDEITGLTLPYIQPELGIAGVRLTSNRVLQPWGELTMKYASSSVSADGNATKIDPNNLETSPAFRVYNLRGGISIGSRVFITAAVENITDELYGYFRYATASSYTPVYSPGRQFVLGTSYRF